MIGEGKSLSAIGGDAFSSDGDAEWGVPSEDLIYDDAKIARLVKEGRGQGALESYKPWRTVREVPSRGTTTECPGRKTGRMHLLFSKLERSAFMAFQWMDSVHDIREQYPLLPLTDTMEIAEKLAVRHPSYKGKPVVMTTDFLIIYEGGEATKDAVAIKYAKDLQDERVLEQLEVERQYWNAREVRWRIVTEKELPEGLVSNLSWLDEQYDIDPATLASKDIEIIEKNLLPALRGAPEEAFYRTCLKNDDRLGYCHGSSLIVARHALARKRWRLPLTDKIDPSQPIPDLVVRIDSGAWIRGL